MGVPTLKKLADRGCASGSDLYANDGAILAETQGNLERRVNIIQFANHFAVHVNFCATWTAEGLAVDHGDPWDAVEFVLPVSCKLVGYNWIGFDGNDGTADQHLTFQRNGALHLTGPTVTNEVTVGLVVKDLNLNVRYTLAEKTMDESNKDFGADIGSDERYLAQGWLCIVRRTIDEDAFFGTPYGYSFDPWIQGHFLFKTEHV